ncbi:MAG: DUF3151 domain-containing protein [Actinomycetota bacterium]|nr:DUF3151 domain-containing protein [Actinomycetota bacterium]
MPENPVNLSSGLPETALDPEPADAREALAAALAAPREVQRDAVAQVAIRWPRYLDAWARLGALYEDDTTSSGSVSDRAAAYACYRVGYHRGLDQLRQSGWRGQGYVRWRHAPNRGFLRSLAGLARVAGAVGEDDEARRCLTFIAQLDPGWDGGDA